MKKILVVDDAKNILLVLEMSLKNAGYCVITARNGLEALEKAQFKLPDIILLDILLPKMNGFLVLEALKEEAKTENIPVIILSACSEKKDIEKAKQLGAKEYLLKPVKPDKLLKTVKNYIQE